MGSSFTSKTKRIIWMAVAGVVTLILVLITTQKSIYASSNIVIPDASISSNLEELNEELKIQIPNSDKLDKELKNHKPGVGAPTKNMINGNGLVKDKNGNIDESKVMDADNDSSRKALLVAGNLSPDAAHDLGNGESDAIAKAKPGKGVDLKAGVVNGNGDDDERSKTPSKKISSDKKHAAKDSNGSKDNAAKKTEKSAALKAQEKAQKEGVSVDMGSDFNPKEEFEKILSKAPVVIFSKSYCPFSKKLKKLLEKEYNISPPPVIVELDQHENGKELQDHVGKETGRFTVPNFIVSGKSKGGADDILALHENDELVDVFHLWSDGAAKIQKLGADY